LIDGRRKRKRSQEKAVKAIQQKEQQHMHTRTHPHAIFLIKFIFRALEMLEESNQQQFNT